MDAQKCEGGKELHGKVAVAYRIHAVLGNGRKIEQPGNQRAVEIDRRPRNRPRAERHHVDSLAGVRHPFRIAPEHLEILTRNPLEWLPWIENAGAVFLGPYSSEPVGDYYAGPNHILPTNGTARFSSPLSVDDFVKKSSVIAYSRQALLDSAHDIMVLARAEGFEGHARAIEVRLEKEGEAE